MPEKNKVDTKVYPPHFKVRLQQKGRDANTGKFLMTAIEVKYNPQDFLLLIDAPEQEIGGKMYKTKDPNFRSLGYWITDIVERPSPEVIAQHKKLAKALADLEIEIAEAKNKDLPGA